jgi:hypothetical protein
MCIYTRNSICNFYETKKNEKQLLVDKNSQNKKNQYEL